MIEWCLSSSILIMIVAALRAVFKGRISLRLQYAVWGLVLLRLLIPVSFGSTNISVANLTVKNDSTAIKTTLPPNAQNAAIATGSNQTGIGDPFEGRYDDPEIDAVIHADAPADISGMLRNAALVIWMAGAVSVSVLFLMTNIRLRKKVMQSRRAVGVYRKKLEVYCTDAIDTPCLFGLLKPVIYVTNEVAGDKTLLRHTIIHEATHHRHGDHIWAVLRCACLVIHWYNPLAWWAAFLSQRDAELACDEATIKRLGEGERAEYGRTLIGMTCQKRARVLITATTMTASESGLRERIMLIARKPRTALYTLLIVLLAASVAVGCTFTGAKADAFEGNISGETEEMPGEYGEVAAGEASTDITEPAKADDPADPDDTVAETLGKQDAAKAKLEKLLSGEDVFWDQDQTESMTISQYCQLLMAGSEVEAVITKYAFADLDADDLPELILWITVNGIDDYGFLVIRYDENNGAIGYSFSYRQMMNLKADGTFDYSGGAADNGVAKLKFTESGWEYVILGCTGMNGGEITFSWNGKSVSQDGYWSHIDGQTAKESAQWAVFHGSSAE